MVGGMSYQDTVQVYHNQFAGWWFQQFFNFFPSLGEMIQFDYDFLKRVETTNMWPVGTWTCGSCEPLYI